MTPARPLYLPPTRRPRGVPVMLAGLATANLGAWAWALLAFQAHPGLMGAGLLAWGLGLRHGLDADHIAAIDGATRKLMQHGRRPATVGLWFALGHSSVVVLATAAVVLAARDVAGMPLGALELLSDAAALAGMAGTIVFLVAIAISNIATAAGLWRALRRVEGHAAVAPGGLVARLLRPSLGMVRRSWHLFPVGFLFGLRFDTASAMALLAVSATQAGDGVSVWAVMALPALFTAGMALVDALDGLLMVRAIEWAFAAPLRRLRYNLALTLLSAGFAGVAAAVHGFQLLGERVDLGSGAGRAAEFASTHADLFGLGMVAVFVALWVGAVLVARHHERAAGLDARGAAPKV